MNLTDSKEWEKLLQWAKEHEDKSVFVGEFDEKTDSYYITRSSGKDNIWEYAPENVNDFIAQCQNIWGSVQEDEVLKILALAILKAEPAYQEGQEKCMEADMECNDKIPEYIYVF